MTNNQLLDRAATRMADGVNNREAYLEGVLLVFALEEQIKKTVKEMAGLATFYASLTKATAKYAIDHPTVMAVPISDEGRGVKSGISVVDGEQCKLSISRGKPMRIDGGEFTQEFLRNLPERFTTTRRSLLVSGLDGMSNDELKTFGMKREPKYSWSKNDK